MTRWILSAAIVATSLMCFIGTAAAQFHKSSPPAIEAYAAVAENKDAPAIQRAQSFLLLGNIDKAETFLRQVIVNDGAESYPAAKILIHRLIMLGEFHCAIRLLEELESVSPAPEMERYMLGVLLEEDGQTEQAVAILRRIVSQEVGDALNQSPEELTASAYRYRKDLPNGPVLHQTIRKFRGDISLEMEPDSVREASLFALIHLIRMTSDYSHSATETGQEDSIITAGQYVLRKGHTSEFLKSVVSSTRDEYPEIAFSAGVDAGVPGLELMSLADSLPSVKGAVPFRKLVGVVESSPEGVFRDHLIKAGMRWIDATSHCLIRNERFAALANAILRPGDHEHLDQLISNELEERDEDFVHQFDTSKRGFWPLSFHFPSNFGIPTSLFQWLVGSDFSSGTAVIVKVLESRDSDQYQDLLSILKWKQTREFQFNSQSDFSRACNLAKTLTDSRYDDLAAGFLEFQSTAKDKHRKYVGLIITRLLASKKPFRDSLGEQGLDLARWIQFMPLEHDESAEVVSNLRKIGWDDVVLTILESEDVVSVVSVNDEDARRAVEFLGFRANPWNDPIRDEIPTQANGLLVVSETKWSGGAITINWINNAAPALAKDAALNALNRFAHERFRDGYTNKPLPDWLRDFLLRHFTEEEIFENLGVRSGIAKHAREGVILDLLNHPERAVEHFRSILASPGGEELGAVKIQLASIISRSGELDDFLEALNLEIAVTGSYPAAIPHLPVSATPMGKEYCRLLAGSLHHISDVVTTSPELRDHIVERVISFLGPAVKIDMNDEELCDAHFDLSRQCLEFDELRGLGIVSLIKNHRSGLFEKEGCSAGALWKHALKATEYAANQGNAESLFPAHAKRHSIETEWSYGQEIAGLAADSSAIDDWQSGVKPILENLAKASPALASAVQAQFHLRFGSSEEFQKAADALFDENGATYDLTQELLRITESRGFDEEIEMIEDRFVAESAAAGVYAFTGDRVEKLLAAGRLDRAKRLYRNGLVSLLGSVPADSSQLKKRSQSAFKTQTRFDFGRRLLADGAEHGVLLPIALEAVQGAELTYSHLKNLGLPMDRITRPSIRWSDNDVFKEWPFFCRVEDFDPIPIPANENESQTTVFNQFAVDLGNLGENITDDLVIRLKESFGGRLLLALAKNPNLTAEEFFAGNEADLEKLPADRQAAIKQIFDPTGSDR